MNPCRRVALMAGFLALLLLSEEASARARTYHPGLGRFMQRDPAGYVDGMNQHAAYHVMHGGVDPTGNAAIYAFNDATRKMSSSPAEWRSGDQVWIGDPERGEPRGGVNALYLEHESGRYLAISFLMMDGSRAEACYDLRSISDYIHNLTNDDLGNSQWLQMKLQMQFQAMRQCPPCDENTQRNVARNFPRDDQRFFWARDLAGLPRPDGNPPPRKAGPKHQDGERKIEELKQFMNDEVDSEITEKVLRAGSGFYGMGVGTMKDVRAKGSRKPSSQMRSEWEDANGKPWPKDPATGGNQDVSHKKARADGGDDSLDNYEPQPHADHVKKHIDNGDFKRWGARSRKDK